MLRNIGPIRRFVCVVVTACPRDKIIFVHYDDIWRINFSHVGLDPNQKDFD